VGFVIDSTVLLAGVSLALGVLMAGAGISKLRAPRAAVAAIEVYGLVPPRAAALLATPLAIAELVSGLAIALPASRAAGAAMVLLLLSIYTVAVGILLARGRVGADCGCGSLVGGVPIGFGLLSRNLVLCGAALASACMRAEAPRGLAQWSAVALIALLGWSLCTASDLLLARERLMADD
jgi:hypothetical protein